MKKIIKQIIPKFLFDFYHKFLAQFSAYFYRWPSRKMIVIGVTGTGGKSTVVNFIGRILEEAGYKVGWTSTLNFKVANKEWINTTKMTMLGRLELQKLLYQMVQAGCHYAIIETSSEGILQFRHLAINYDVAVFTNLSPEHIERHGSFENYRAAKGQLFAKLKESGEKPKIINQREIKKVRVINLDDSSADYFKQFSADEYYGFSLKSQPPGLGKQKNVCAENLKFDPSGSEFQVQGVNFKLNLLGQFNIENALAAIAVASSQNVSLEICQKALEKIQSLPGRMEIINQEPRVIVDYAHTPHELEAVYQTLKVHNQPNTNLVCVLGSAGGGRDKWKRPELGKIAGQYCHEVIVTNEDPYDENPQKIIDQVIEGVSKDIVPFKILDRREAIKKALMLAQNKDVVIITGKGCEQCIMGPNNTKIPWDDRQAVRDVLTQK